MTSLTRDEFRQLVSPFETAFQVHMAAWRLDEQPRTARRYTTYKHCPLPAPEGRLLFGMGQRKAHQLDPCPVGRPTGAAAHAGGCAQPVRDRAGEAPWGDRGRRERTSRVGAGAAERVRCARRSPSPTPSFPPFAHDGTERRVGRPQDPTEQTRCDRGKNKCHTVKHVLLINAMLTILFLSETYEGRTHDKRMADATPYPLPAGSRLLQTLGFQACTLDQVEIRMPTRKPRGRALTRNQQVANRRIARRRVRIEHVNRRVKRGRIVHDTCRLRKAGVRDLIMAVCWVLHNFRVRLTPWQPMV